MVLKPHKEAYERMKHKTAKRKNNRTHIFFLGRFALFFAFWALDLAIFDLKFGFYVKFPPYNRLEGLESGVQVKT